MCGIAGIVHFNGTSVQEDQLRRMTNTLAHRGPDGDGYFTEAGVGLGHRRLSILDLSDAASQPMKSDDGNIVLIFNGEIYNFQEKRVLLESKGYRFRSSGDTEVLLKLYEAFGTDCVSHLRGMFAFAIYDKRKNILFLARDRVGKKPLKYFFHGNTFAFASELKALRMLPDCPREIDQETLHHYLTMMYCPSPRTGLKGIRKLPAAHSLTIDLRTGKHAIARYWSLTYQADNNISHDEWKERLHSTFEECVKLRMIADVPLGAFLSGGIDSAAVVAFMSKLSSKPVQTFSIGSREETHNELPDAARIAKLYTTDHHPITVEPDIVHLLPELVRSYEEPFADPSVIPTYLVSRETRRHVTVALNGDGGDENFAGYVRYPIFLFSQQWARLPSPMHALAKAVTHVLYRSWPTTFAYRCHRFQSTMTLRARRRYLQYLSFFTEEEKRSLYAAHADFPRTDVMYEALTDAASKRAADPLHRIISMDIDTYLADDLMPKVDMGSMAHGLEARSPFLDHTLLELTARMPADLKIRGGNRKLLLKEALTDILPDQTLRKKKTGFRVPLDRWFRNDLRSFVVERLLSDAPHKWEFLDKQNTERFLNTYFSSRVDYSDHIWALLWLDEWLRQYTL